MRVCEPIVRLVVVDNDVFVRLSDLKLSLRHHVFPNVVFLPLRWLCRHLSLSLGKVSLKDVQGHPTVVSDHVLKSFLSGCDEMVVHFLRFLRLGWNRFGNIALFAIGLYGQAWLRNVVDSAARFCLMSLADVVLLLNLKQKVFEISRHC